MENQIIRGLKDGNIITVPTETVEGYAVSLYSEVAVRNLMKLKERGFDSGKVFTLVPESKKAISKYVVITPIAKELIRRYVPGEITLILPKNPGFSHFYYDHFNSIGIRIPAHPLFDRILQEVGPIILTSANPRGGTPKSLTGHKPSTIVDLTGEVPKIIREGNLKIKL